MRKRLLPALLALYAAFALLPGAALAEYSGQLLLKPVNAARYIDRVELPDFAIALYETLEEAADGDGYRDYLIDDEYFDLSGENVSSNNPGDFIRGDVRSSSTGITTRYTAILITGVETASADEATNAYILDCIGTVAAAFHRDHPEVFWLSGYSCICYIRNGRMYYCYVLSSSSDAGASDRRIAEFRPGGGLDLREVMAKRDADVEKIISTIPAGAGRYTQIYYLNKWLTENNSYNTIVRSGLNNGVPTKEINRPWDSTRCVSALAGQKGAAGPECGGYANAFKVLCDALGIPCVHVRYDHGATSHSWNYAQMEDGKWYAVDVDLNDRNDDGANLTKWLLVGGKTVIDGKEFLVSHPAENPVFTNGVAFPNGPVLSDDAYSGARLGYDGLPETPAFTDVPDWCAAAVGWAAGQGVAQGYGGGIFGPDDPCSNAQILTFLWRAAGEPRAAASPFTVAGHYQGAVDWAYEKGMIGAAFRPGADCTRSGAVTYIWQAFGAPAAAGSGFSDVPAGADGAAAVSWAVSLGVANGFPGNVFRPGDTCTRGQIVTFLYRAYKS